MMRFGENKTDLSVAALWLVIGGEVFHIEGQPSRQVLCLGGQRHIERAIYK